MASPTSRSAILSSFIALLAACGSEGETGDMASVNTASDATSCITLVGQTCGCPGGRGYGKFACDGSCTECVAPAAGSGGAGSGSAGMNPPRPVNGAAGSGTPSGSAGMAASAGAPGAGMAGAPAAGSGTGAAGSAATLPAAGASAPTDPEMVDGTTSGDVPDSAACAPVAMWTAEATGFEQEVLTLVNQNRAKGWNCDTEGQFPAAGPLAMNPLLRCSARLHSKDMADRMFFAHDNPDGENPGARMKEVGYSGRGWGENIAKGQRTPAEVVQGWMDSDGHCSNIMNASFNQLGVGYFAGMSDNPRYNSELYWTQNFGASAAARP